MGDSLRQYYYQGQTLLRRYVPSLFASSCLHDFSVFHSPAVLLGRTFESDVDLESNIRMEFEHLIWMTYRDELEPGLLADGKLRYRSDAGWGCMIRTMQMILAEALRRHHLRVLREFEEIHGKDFVGMQEMDLIYSNVIEKFLDVDHENIAPLSIYQLLSTSYPGKWFGSHETSMLASQCFKKWKDSPINLVVSQDNSIFKSDLKAPVCILVSVRLGLNDLNPTYVLLDFFPPL